MPRIRDDFLECVIYLYPSWKDAEEGSAIGGSGFLIGVPTENLAQNFWCLYAVTNKHVINDGSRVIRLTTREGDKCIHETEERDWIFHSDGDDLAICLISIDPNKVQFRHISHKELLTKEECERLRVGIGDDVFIVGRFINHEGRQRNSPTARFGSIAQMPLEPIKMGGFDQECFLVEARSIGGFSGSPAFWHVLPFGGGQVRLVTNWSLGPLLLGVEAGYMYDWLPVCDSAGRPITFQGVISQQVRNNSGMMIVIPAWKLASLLVGDKALAQRHGIEEQVRSE